MQFDEGWLDLIQTEVREAIQGTVLHDAEIILVSSKSKKGLKELQLALERALARVSEKADHTRPRLPIDRVFTMSGFGTVVTGTLSDGELRVGMEVEVAPRGLRSRIRGLQSHKEKVETARVGGRVAVNLANVATEELQRGDVLIVPGAYAATTMLDARIEWLASAPKPLAHSHEVEMFLFSTQVTARVRFLEGDTLRQGATGWAQLVLKEPVIAAKGDRFIMRYPSPSVTVGGGTVVDPHPRTRHKRNNDELLARLERAMAGTPDELVLQYVDAHPAAGLEEIREGVSLEPESMGEALADLVASGALVAVPIEPKGDAFLTKRVWEQGRMKILDELAQYHKLFPMRRGMPREELRSRTKMQTRVLDAVLLRAAAENAVRATDKMVALRSHEVQFSPAIQVQVNALLAQFANAPYNPPAYSEAEEAIGADALHALIEQGALVRVSPNVLLTPLVADEMQTWVVETLQSQNEITAAQLRDRFNTSRKYAIAFLEYLDARHVTRRVGDARVLR
jgi:selenocysteine-specific elongation factor